MQQYKYVYQVFSTTVDNRDHKSNVRNHRVREVAGRGIPRYLSAKLLNIIYVGARSPRAHTAIRCACTRHVPLHLAVRLMNCRDASRLNHHKSMVNEQYLDCRACLHIYGGVFMLIQARCTLVLKIADKN